MTVRLRDRTTEIRVVPRATLLADLPLDRFLVTDDVLAPLFPEIVPDAVVPAGEAAKTLVVHAGLSERMAAKGCSRRTTVVALGGGVIGDLAGFLAATWMRGVDLLMIPTTLLAQVDSSVGGKTGVDLAAGKNLVGAFHPASEVRICPTVLATLPDRQIRNGLAECLKYGFIAEPDLLPRFTGGLPDEAAILRCVDLKRRIVEADEFETTGLRATLNFGHTIGHAIEHLAGYDGSLLHGEAIAIGMTLEARLGEKLGITAPGTAIEVADRLHAVGLPVQLPTTARPDALISVMRGDKKASGGRLAFALLDRIGSCRLVKDVPELAVREVLA